MDVSGAVDGLKVKPALGWGVGRAAGEFEGLFEGKAEGLRDDS